MATDDFQLNTIEQRLKTSIYNDTRKICREVGGSLNMEFDQNSMELIAELVWKKTQSFGSDLEEFCRHAKRSTINSEDVKLLVRRNSSLKEHISRLADARVAAAVSTKEGNKRKRKPTADDD